jgi:glycosyltransferase involved in cell wall biosynthesis
MTEAKEGKRPVVLQVLPELVTGGVERGTLDMAAALSGAGMTALVASAGGPMVHPLEQRCGATHVTLPLATKNPLKIRRNAEALAGVIRHFGVDLVHARSRAPAWSAYYATRTTGCHFVTTFHAPYGLGGALKQRYNSVMARSERVIAISHFVADYIRNNYQVEESRLRIIHRGVDTELFDPVRVSAERVIQLSTQWRLADGVPVILLPGRLTRWKGQQVLIEAAAKLKQSHQFVCLIVGSDQGRSAYSRELKAQISALDLTDRVALFDDCKDMPAAYMLSDVVVSASIEPEGFGRVVSEGQAMGRPVVVSDHGGGREQVLPEETGFLYPPTDPAALAAALAKALDLSAAARARLGETAIAHARAQFSKTAMCAKTLAVYRELIGEWAPAAAAPANAGAPA